MKINFDFSTFVDNLSTDEVEDLKTKLNYVGYSTNENINELKAVVGVFIEDNGLENINSKEDFWAELINFGYKLGDRILSFNNKILYGSDVEELQELLSRMGFYSEPINGKYSRSVVEGVTKFQENRGITIDGVVGHNTVYEIKKLIRIEQAYWPKNISVVASKDKSKEVRTMLNDLQNSVIAAVVLVFIIIIGILGFRSALLVGIAIPGSFLLGILIISIAGISINMMVLFALIMAVGMLVDGAIVVTELADRRMREGDS